MTTSPTATSNALGRNLNAALDIRGGRLALRELSRGLADPGHYFSGFDIGSAPLGAHRNMGDKLMSVLDDLTRSMARSCGLRLVPPMIISGCGHGDPVAHSWDSLPVLRN